MVFRPVYTINAPPAYRRILKTPAKRVGRIDQYTRHLVDEMFATLDVVGGVGLAAPQIGVPLAIFVVAYAEHKIAVVNPSLTKVSREAIPFDEGCLSLPGTVTQHILRPAAILMKGFDEHGAAKKWRLDGPLARIFQHEYDHLRGVLINNHVRDVRQLATAG